MKVSLECALRMLQSSFQLMSMHSGYAVGGCVCSVCLLYAKCNSSSGLFPYRAIVNLLRRVPLPGGEASEDAAQEDFQYKLKGFIDSTVDKR